MHAETRGLTKYPNVKNAHIVPRTYLSNWAIDDKIAVWLVPEGRRLHDQPVDKVGTRRRFYRRIRPQSGEEIDDVEAMLGEGESRATPLLRSFAERWPLYGFALLYAFVVVPRAPYFCALRRVSSNAERA